jgi:hypothetical protein
MTGDVSSNSACGRSRLRLTPIACAVAILALTGTAAHAQVLQAGAAADGAPGYVASHDTSYVATGAQSGGAVGYSGGAGGDGAAMPAGGRVVNGGTIQGGNGTDGAPAASGAAGALTVQSGGQSVTAAGGQAFMRGTPRRSSMPKAHASRAVAAARTGRLAASRLRLARVVARVATA